VVPFARLRKWNAIKELLLPPARESYSRQTSRNESEREGRSRRSRRLRSRALNRFFFSHASTPRAYSRTIRLPVLVLARPTPPPAPVLAPRNLAKTRRSDDSSILHIASADDTDALSSLRLAPVISRLDHVSPSSSSSSSSSRIGGCPHMSCLAFRLLRFPERPTRD
jgi:hypothetical protein